MKPLISAQTKKLFAILALVAITSPAWATMQTVTLTIPSMHCETCPITVKHALSKVKGVAKIGVSLEKREVVVTFDDDKTNVRAITMATKNAGYPSTVKH